MASKRFDRELASAEARLDRLDVREEDGGASQTDMDEAEALASGGMHIDEGVPLEVTDDSDERHAFGNVTDLVDAFNEAFNARDFDGLVDLLSQDVETPGLGNDRAGMTAAVEDLWNTHPSAILTRGELGGEPVSILWEVGDDGRWWRTAPLMFQGAEGELTLVELVDDPDATAEAIVDEPDEEFDEGTRWEEWESGVPPD